VEALRASLVDAEQLLGLELADDYRDPETSEVHPSGRSESSAASMPRHDWLLRNGEA
jgi:hypothetical protein